MKRIIIAADIVPTQSNYEQFVKSDTHSLLGSDLKKRLKEASFIAMNLEVPLVNQASPIRKCGPHLIAPTSTISGIKAINPCFMTLANNHIMDQGVAGLSSTLQVLSQSGIDYSGVGIDLAAARKPYVRTVDNVKIGIYCCAEHEFSIATDDRAGANPYDPLVSFDDVQVLKKNCDYLIVLYHGGKEHYRYPSPMLRRVFHKFADVGADLIIAQHTHCIGCKEEYHGSTLVYGQGNFLFDYSESEFWKTSLLVEVELSSKKVEYIPLVKKGGFVREAKSEEKEKILNEFIVRSNEILNEGFIEAKYKELAMEMRNSYLLRFSGGFAKSFVFRALLKATHLGYLNRFYRDESAVAIENVLDCEAHRELASEALRGLVE